MFLLYVCLYTLAHIININIHTHFVYNCSMPKCQMHAQFWLVSKGYDKCSNRTKKRGKEQNNKLEWDTPALKRDIWGGGYDGGL